MEIILQDVKYAMRALLKVRTFSIMVVVTLALGIGAATAIFSIVDAILLRPLPFADPDRLVVFNETTRRGRMTLAWPNYLDILERATSFESIAAYRRTAFTVIDAANARRFDGRYVTAGFLDVLGVRPQLGRTFNTHDDRVGADPVIIVSDRFWKQHLGGDLGVVDRTLRTSEGLFRIVGVLPPEFRFAGAEDLLAPIGPTAMPDSVLIDRANHTNLYGVARLKPGVQLERARADLDRIAADLAREYPAVNAGSGAEVHPLRDRFVEGIETTLIALMGAVGFLLLLACANVMNLLLARGAARHHELAIRSALGGTRGRLVRELLTESAMLSLAGGALGVLLATWLVTAIVFLAPPDTPRINEVAINQTSLLFALAASLMCGLFFGALPAIQASGARRGAELMATAARTAARVSPRRTRRILIGAQVTLALILLSGCGLMIRTLVELANVDPGFRPENLLTARVVLSGDQWKAPERRLAFFERTLEVLSRIPGVTGAAVTLSLPIEGSNWGSVFIASGKPIPSTAELPSAAFNPVSDGYFQAMGMAVKRGRGFTAADGADAAKVVVVNETLANRMWPGEDPIGQRLKQGFPADKNPWREVVGVVADVRLSGVDQPAPLQVFIPLAQNPADTAAIVARTAVEPGTLAKALESAVHVVEPDLPVMRILPMTSVMSGAVATRRVSTMIFSTFAFVAILIATVGLYGVVSHSVTERTREIGVRMALGAGRGRVLLLVAGQGMATAVIGAVAGIAGALALSGWFRQLVVGVTPTDPTTLATVSTILLIVAGVACYLPARRAAALDPLVALRHE